MQVREAPPQTEAELEERLARPTPGTIAALREYAGDLLILGAGGKMGPSLARLARRSADAAGRSDLRVIAVSRFSQPELRTQLHEAGVETIACDLLDPAARDSLPDAPHVLFMLGHKFSGGGHPSQYWGMNAWLPGALAERFRNAQIVCFSSGNVYPFVPTDGPAPTEEHPCGPVGEYATTAWGRERTLEFFSRRYGTPVVLLRLNYAVELRYGVPVDIAAALRTGQPIDQGVPYVNVVWQGYANAVALQAFPLAGSPATLLNLTGGERLSVRWLAEQLAQRLGVEASFRGSEGTSALLSDASRCLARFGPPDVDVPTLLDWIAAWQMHDGRLLGKPTRFQVRDGVF